LIKIHKLSKDYTEGGKTHHVLKGIDFEIKPGEIIIMFGRSGSGKSTLLNLLSGIDLPSSGSLEINGTDITKLDERARTIFRREKIGFIFQFFNLIPTLTVLENLLLPLELVGADDKAALEKAMSLISEVGLSGREDSYPDRLSGGEQQRVAIARALAHDPEIILADEPTGNLDFETGTRIIELLDRLIRKRGKTMIMATHSRDTIGLADRIVTVSEGLLRELSAEEI
jgi:putative ABC transport system ATP-binding protein